MTQPICGQVDVDPDQLQLAIQPLRDQHGTLQLSTMKPKAIPDSPQKIIITGCCGMPVAMMLLSQRMAPDLVSRGVAVGEEIRSMLGEELGSAIIDPIASGDLDGRSYTLLPWHVPLADSRLRWVAQRVALRGHVLRWLRRAGARAAAFHCRAATPTNPLIDALVYVSELQVFADELRSAADEALLFAEKGRWSPTVVFNHSDLWKGNVLRRNPVDRAAARQTPFVIIDWLGAESHGGGMVDLVRFIESFRLGQWAYRNAVSRHCSTMGWTVREARWQMLISIGQLGQRLEYYGIDRFADQSNRCWRLLLSATQ